MIARSRGFCRFSFGQRGQLLLACLLVASVVTFSAASAAADYPADYPADVLADSPVAYWRFADKSGPTISNSATGKSPSGDFAPSLLDGRIQGSVALKIAGPRPTEDQEPEGFLDFTSDNLAADFHGGSRVIITDPGEKSPLDFDLGDAMTLEAWVDLTTLGPGDNACVVGKGRTGRPGQKRDNQNYALRLREQGGSACVNFLFRGVKNRPESNRDSSADWHRWTSNIGFTAGSGWHHVAISYKFGEPDSIRGYLDGQPLEGVWDMGGPSADPPVVDDDEVWIGSTMMGNVGNSVDGSIDEVAIHRSQLSAERMQARFRHTAPQYKQRELPPGRVLVEVFEGVPPRKWSQPQSVPSQVFEKSTLAFAHLPPKYSDKAIIVDRANLFLVRSSALVALPAGENRLHIRALGGTRLSIDGKVLATTRFLKGGGGDAEAVAEDPTLAAPDMRLLPTGHAEQLAVYQSTGEPVLVVLDAMIGDTNARQDVGEISVSVQGADGSYYLLQPDGVFDIPLTDAGWHHFAERDRHETQQIAQQMRQQAGSEEAEYWERRHALARQVAAQTPPPAPPKVGPNMPVLNPIDQYLGAKMEAAGVSPAPVADDHVFLRRLALDTVGVIPTPTEIAEFESGGESRRTEAIDRFLADGRWADHWVSYWQDVLAENPGILKPMLNNTGPFRFWIHEALFDNRPIDRMATELIQMEGSTYYGGPAGFSLATQNDVPMAAKAHVIGQAFLAVEMKCARCHDAPHHDLLQKDLFSLAAMLKRNNQSVPKSSSIPVSPERLAEMIVKVTLKPGASVAPEWPFEEFATADAIPEGVMRRSTDSRERLAALITGPGNDRFAQVIANRIWQQLLGAGIIDPVDDWEHADASHPELLEYLGYELVQSGYDMKALARLIMTSHAYQRAITPEGTLTASTSKAKERLFAAPARRRMSAEQVVDSMFVAAGKRLGTEPLTLDPDCRRPVKDFQNLGVPERAWEFTSLSNERDRPALALPKAQGIVDMLATFGWRDSRPDPISCRDDTPTVQQPALIANGIITRRIASLSDDSALTEIAMSAASPEQLVERFTRRILSRSATEAELGRFAGLLREGFDNRQRQPEEPHDKAEKKRYAVSWSNHLNPEATRMMLELEKAARAGDPPTERLEPQWRERAETVAWVLVNSPEFVYLP